MSKYANSGLGSNAKITKYRLREIEGEEQLFLLTSRNVGALIESTEPLSWRNRHLDIPSELLSNDAFMAWIDDLRLRLMTPIDFCQFMIDNSECFFDNETVQGYFDEQINRSLDNKDSSIYQKLVDLIKNNSGSSVGSITTNLLVDDCDFDVIWSQVSEIIDVLDGLTEDLLELITAIEGVYERVTTMIDAIPVVEATPAPAIFKFVGEAMTGLKTEYEGNFTLETSIELKCELFCLIKNSPDCKWNWVQLTAFYLGKINQELGETDIFEVINAIITYLSSGDILGNTAIYGLFAFSCSILASGGSFVGETFGKVAALVYSKKDEPSNDWNDLCEDCSDGIPENCISFLEDKNGYDIKFEIGNWVSGSGFKSIPNAGTFALYVHQTATSGVYTKLIVKFDFPVTNVGLANDNGTDPYTYTGSATVDVEFSADTITGFVSKDLNQGIFIYAVGMTNRASIVEVCFTMAE